MRRVFIWLCVAALIFSTSCKKEDEQPDNAECESSCVAKYARAISGCERRSYECLSDCAGPDDIDCTWDCEDYEFECLADFSICSGYCPCARDTAHCGRSCPDNDTACLQDCVDGYIDCAGDDSAYLCANDCQTSLAICKSGCDEQPYDSEQFTTCRASCADEAVQCLEACE